MMFLIGGAMAAGIRFAAAGDTMMGSDLSKGAAGLAPEDGLHLFDGVKEWFRAADIAFLNLEGPLADGLPNKKCAPGSTSCYSFRTPTRYTAALTDMGIDVVSLANNHAWDLGPEGQESSMRALDAAGIRHAGRYGDIAWLEQGGKKIAVLAAHFGACCLNVNNIPEVQAAIREADKTADIVVFSYHAGAEGSSARRVLGAPEIAWGEARGDVKALSRAAVEAGADLILGHGPHVLRAMEVYQGRLIAYSLGNFCGFRQFGTQGGYGGTSMVLEAELGDAGELLSGLVRPVLLDSESKPRPDPAGAAIRQVQELTGLDFPQGTLKIGMDGRLSW